MDDEEAPPDLVDVSQLPDAEKAVVSTTIQDTPAQDRVPITLVTGMIVAMADPCSLISTSI